MKEIIADHFRRWWWVWILGVLVSQAMMIGICMPRENPVAGQMFSVLLFLGPFLLTFDLQRGHARVLVSMPVTIREIARAWWLATVAIPSLALAVMMGLAYAFVMTVSPGPVSSLRLLNCWLMNSILLGVMFFALTGMPARQGVAEGVDRIRGYFFGILWGLSFAGWYFFNNFLSIGTATGLAVYALGGVLTIIGWFRAETLVRERAGLQGRQLAPSPTAKSWRGHGGYGGMRYLFEAFFQRLLVQGLWMFTVVIGVFGLMFFKAGLHSVGNRPGSFSFLSSITFQLLFIMSFQVIPVISHIRFLRTLPVSTTKLAGLIVLTPLAAMVMVVYLANLLTSAILGLPWFVPSGLLHQGYWVQIAIASWFIPIFVWRGMDAKSLVVILGVMMGGMLGAVVFEKAFSSMIANLIAPFLILGAFLATKYLLDRNSRPYRPRGNQMQGWNWSVSR